MKISGQISIAEKYDKSIEKNDFEENYVNFACFNFRIKIIWKLPFQTVWTPKNNNLKIVIEQCLKQFEVIIFKILFSEMLWYTLLCLEII